MPYHPPAPADRHTCPLSSRERGRWEVSGVSPSRPGGQAYLPSFIEGEGTRWEVSGVSPLYELPDAKGVGHRRRNDETSD